MRLSTVAQLKPAKKIRSPLSIINYNVDDKIIASSFTMVALSGKNRKVKNTLSNSFYFVVSGSGVFAINDKTYQVSAGDLIYIAKDDTYQDSGKMTLLCISSPPFNAETVEYIS